MSKKDAFDIALDEAVQAVVQNRIESVTEALERFTKRIEQEVNTNRSATGSSEPDKFPKLPGDKDEDMFWDDHYPIG